MDLSKPLNRKLSEVLRHWSLAVNNCRFYGFDTPQARNTRSELLPYLKEVLDEFGEFFFVRKQDVLELKGSGWNLAASEVQARGLIEVIMSGLEKLKINSISFKPGLSLNELEKLFKGLSLSIEELDKYQGLQGFLSESGVKCVESDQFHYELLKKGEKLSQDAKTEAVSFEPPEPDRKKVKDLFDKKEFSSFWSSFLQKESANSEGHGKSEEFLEYAKENPGELVKIIKRILKKQKNIEDFIECTRGRLLSFGFGSQVIDDIENKLKKPKKVYVSAEELSRLRKMEKEFELTLQKRLQEAQGQFKDVSRRLTEQWERLNSAVRQSSQGVIVLDEDDCVVSVNPIAETSLGIHMKDCLGKDLDDVLRASSTPAVCARWSHKRAGISPTEVKIVAPDDSTRDMIAGSSAVIENQNGKAIGMVSALQQLIALRELEKRKQDILDVLGHDLRSPVVAAKQNLSVLLDAAGLMDRLDEPQKNMAKACLRNIEKMEKLVFTIMDVRQFETGKIILRMEPVKVSSLIEEAAALFRSWAENKQIRIVTSLDAVADLSGDNVRLQQVLANLVSNALKYTPKGGAVEMKASSVDEQGRVFVRVEVKDSGIGINKDDVERIFNKYEQISLRSPSGETGLGLGLALCKAIVELHGGKIWAESREGEGSSFIFTIPCL